MMKPASERLYMKLAIHLYNPPQGLPARRDMVLIHGTGAKAEMWRGQIDQLVDRGYRCIVPDLRGHGASREPLGSADLESHLEDMLETLAAVPVRFPVSMAGHSLGSIIALELAARRPELVCNILAVSMPARVPRLTTAAFRWLLGRPYHIIRRSGVHRSLGWRERVLIETNHHALSQIATHFADLDYIESPPRVNCPVHFAVGRFDPVAPCGYLQRLHHALPGSTMTIIEWAGHNCMDSQPKAFNRWFFQALED
jgi:pimeloyl-ACP methyl ester carboxylesterase